MNYICDYLMLYNEILGEWGCNVLCILEKSIYDADFTISRYYNKFIGILSDMGLVFFTLYQSHHNTGRN